MHKAIEQLNENWQSNLLENRKVLSLLAKLRNVTHHDKFSSLELGLAEMPAKETLPPKVFKSLKSFGLMNETITGMVSIPLRKKDNRISNFYLLSLNGRDDAILRQGGVMNVKAFSVFTKLVVVDSMDDYLAYFQQVKENVVPLIQSTTMPDDLAGMVKHTTVEELVLVNESPYWDLLKEKLSDSDVKLFEVSLPDNQKISEYLEAHSGQKLTAYIEGEKAKIVKAEKEATPAEEKEYLTMTELTGELRFENEDRFYRVRGFNRDGFEKIVQLSLEMDGRAFPDKVDLSRSNSRTRFANSASHEFEMSPEIVRTDLTFIYKKLDALQDRRFREKSGLLEKQVYVISKDDMKKAIDRLVSRDLLNELLLKDTEKLGYVEEEVNKKLFYLSATSRLTGKPLSVLDISPPGTGKSFGLSTVMDLVPPDEVLKYSRLSPNALYYKSEEDLRGKVLYIEEIVGMEESLEPIRMLLSSGELAVSVVEKDPRTGSLRTMERRIEVDIPILSSGVRDIFDEETLSRFILTYNDVTEKHLERILKAQSFKYSLEGERVFKQKDRVLKKHRDIQKVLDRDLIVINPYAEKIMVNPHLHIVTRKQEHYLRLIYNIAFLRQHSREKKTSEDRYGNAFTYIEVMPEDIDTANEIAGHVFQFAKGDLTKRLHDAYQTIEQYCVKQVKEKRIGLYEYSFTRRDLREHAGWEQTTAKRLFDELEALEYIRRVRGGHQGRQYRYSLIPYDRTASSARDLRLFNPKNLPN